MGTANRPGLLSQSDPVSMHHLVLADDSNTTQTLVRLSFVEDPTIQVHTFEDGTAALEYVQTQPTDLVLAKLALPLLDGYELCRRIKQDPTTSHLRVLLLGRAQDSFDENRAQQIGCDGYLIKPFETSELVARIDALLAQTKSEPKEEAVATDEPTLSSGSEQAPESPDSLPPASESTVRLLTLKPSQCRPDCNFLARDVRRLRRQHSPLSSPAAASASLNEGEMKRLIQDVLNRLPQELRRILPEIIQETLFALARPTSAD